MVFSFMVEIFHVVARLVFMKMIQSGGRGKRLLDEALQRGMRKRPAELSL